MPPKKPNEVKEQVEKQNEENPPREGFDRSAEGASMRRPQRHEFFGNLKKASTENKKN